MVLSDKEILAIQNGEHPLISPFDASKLRAASYDVTLDSKVTVLQDRGIVIDLADQSLVNQIYSGQFDMEGFILKPGQYCLAALDETISLPDDIVARVVPRTRFTRLGLLVAPQFCNPSYSGRLRIGILNASGNNLKLSANMGIAQLVFERLESAPTEERLYRNQETAAYQNEDTFVGALTKDALSAGARDILDRLMC